MPTAKRLTAPRRAKPARPAPAPSQPLVPPSPNLPQLLNAAFLALWSVGWLLGLEWKGFFRAADTDGGVLFALAVLGLGTLFISASLALSGRWRDPPVGVMALFGLVPFFLLRGAAASTGVAALDPAALPWFLGANVLFAALLAFTSPSEALGEHRGTGRAWVLGVAVSLGLGLAVVALHTLAFSRLGVSQGVNALKLFFKPRQVDAPYPSNAVDIYGAPFTAFSRLTLPALWLLLVAMCLRFPRLWEGRRGDGLLVGLAVLGKLAIAGLSSDGWAILGEKIASVNTTYYTAAADVSAHPPVPWGYMAAFNGLQNGPHIVSHPFGPELLYWVLAGVTGHHPAAVAVLVMTLSALAAPLIRRTAEGLYRSPEAGWAAALLYIATPMSLILSGAGVDSIVLVWVALLLLMLQRGHQEPRLKWGIYAGLCLFGGSLFTFGVGLPLIFCGLWSVLARLRAENGRWVPALRGVLALWLPLVLVWVACHLLLAACLGFKYSYLGSIQKALGANKDVMLFRPYSLWSWANTALYIGYAGVATAAVWMIRSFSALRRADSGDEFLMLGIPFLLTLIFAGVIRAEVERVFLYGLLLLVIPAGPYFLKRRGGAAAGLDTWLLLGLLALNLANAVVLEVKVLDFW